MSCAEQRRADGVPCKSTATAGNQAGEELVAMLRGVLHNFLHHRGGLGCKRVTSPMGEQLLRGAEKTNCVKNVNSYIIDMSREPG